MGLAVLVVDDSSLVRFRVTQMLAGIEGVARVEEAADLDRARALIRERAPDVVVLDVKMPGEIGIDLLRELRRKGPHPVVIMLTNYALDPYRRACLDAGANEFLDKSTEFGRLMNIVGQLARGADGAETDGRR